jgi:hypothetical protein
MTAEVQLRHSPPAALAISGMLCGPEPGKDAAEVALGPRERHALLHGFPLLFLQGIAPVNGVLIAEGTWRLVGDLFDYRDLGAVEIRGLDALTRVWQVLCREQSRVASRHCVLPRLHRSDTECRRWHREAEAHRLFLKRDYMFDLLWAV